MKKAQDPLFELPREKILKVMGRLIREVSGTLSESRGVHLVTVVSGTAAMAGLYLLREARLPLDNLPPGQAVFSDAMNKTGPELVGFISAVASMMGMSHDRGWDTAIPAEHEPQKTVSELTKLLEPRFEKVFDDEGIERDFRARFSALSAMDILKQGEKTLPADIGKAIIMRSVIAGSKTVPHPLNKG